MALPRESGTRLGLLDASALTLNDGGGLSRFDTKQIGSRLGLMLLGIALLSLSFAPVYQFYLAWLGLVPFILAIRTTRSPWRALAWGWLGGGLFFGANMWWLVYVSVPGLFALALYLGLFWALAAVMIGAIFARRRGSIATVLLLATTWVGWEWFRGNVSFLGQQGLPWLYLGTSQSPLLVMCQVADAIGISGVSWWVALVNATIAVAIVNRQELRKTLPAIALAACVVIAVGAYGAFRMWQKTTAPGPRVLVVQSNYRQSNSGEKGAPMEQILRFHRDATRSALQAAAARGEHVDLVVWSETMMPPLNAEARFASGADSLAQRAKDELESDAREFRTSFLVGGTYLADWRERGEYIIAEDRRNTAYFIDSEHGLTTTRYDKIHLVPFGEYIPFKESIPPLYRLFIKLGPNYYEDYILTPGHELTVFDLNGRRFVVPICFEDIVPDLVAAMVRGDTPGTKRADFIVNITNDGWFRASQMPQHLQAAIFRSIENRVPTARSVNTGISGFIDSTGRVSNVVPAGSEGTSMAELMLDLRVSLFTRAGDAFALLSAGATIGAGSGCTSSTCGTNRDESRPRSWKGLENERKNELARPGWDDVAVAGRGVRRAWWIGGCEEPAQAA